MLAVGVKAGFARQSAWLNRLEGWRPWEGARKAEEDDGGIARSRAAVRRG